MIPTNIKVKLTRQENAEFFHAQIGDVVEYDFEEYLKGVVASEIGNPHIEAAKAQAICARTFAWKCASTGSPISDSSAVAQAFRAPRSINKAYANAHAGVDATKGILIYYDGKPITTCGYSANNGGRTVSSQERWGGYRPYLIAKDDPWDAAAGAGKTGHGCGLSQRGAKYAASIGIPYGQILSFYYHDTYLVSNYGQTEDVKLELNAKEQTIKTWALSKVGSPYVYGGTEKACTPSYRNARISQYPEYKAKIISNCPVLSKKQSTCAGCKYNGLKCYDCAQLTKFGMKQIGISLPSGASSQWKGNYWALTGTFANRPVGHVHLLYRESSTGNPMSHTGIGLDDGTFVHAKGHDYGVVHESLTTYVGWTHWAIPKELYSQAELDQIQAELNAKSNAQLPTSPIGKATIKSSKWLNVREQKSSKAKDVGDLKKGAVVDYYADDGIWLSIKHNGKLAYCMKAYTNAVLNRVEPTIGQNPGLVDDPIPETPPTETVEAPKVTPGTVKIMTVTSKSVPLNVRSGPGVSFPKVGSLKYGTKVNVLEEKSGWARIEFSPSPAWCSLSYLKMV